MVCIKSSDGTGIAVHVYNSNCEKTVVLVHGWPLNSKIFEYQLPMLIEANVRVVAIDLRGFGDSDTPTCNYTYDQMATDIYYVVRCLGLKCFTLVGFSLGGSIALRYMNNYCGYGVEKLILLSAAAPKWTRSEDYPYGRPIQSANRLVELASTDRPQLVRNFSYQLFESINSTAIIEWFEDIGFSASGLATLETLIALRDEDGRKDLCCVNVPTTIIHGDKDQIVPTDLALIQYHSIPGAKYYNLENSGHGIMYDELKTFNQIFLKEILENNC